MYPWVVQLTFSWSCLMQKDFPWQWDAQTQTLQTTPTGLKCTGSEARIHKTQPHRIPSEHICIYICGGECSNPISIYIILYPASNVSIFSSSIKPPSLTNWFSLSKIRSLHSFFSFDFKILIIKHTRLST